MFVVLDKLIQSAESCSVLVTLVTYPLSTSEIGLWTMLSEVPTGMIIYQENLIIVCILLFFFFFGEIGFCYIAL